LNRLYTLIVSIGMVIVLLTTTTGCVASSLKPQNTLHPKQKLKATFQINSDIFYVNGKEYKMDAPPINESQLYLPVEYVVKALEIPERNVIQDNQKITLSNKNTTVIIEPGKLLRVNGETIKPFRYAKAAFWHEASGKMYVAIVPLAKAFGYDVIQDAESGRIDVITGLPLVEQDFALGQIKTGMSENQLITVLGQPIQVHHEQYSGRESNQKWVEYSGLKIYLEKAVDWKVTTIYITSPNYQTHRGIKVGDSLDKVIELYGLGYYKYGSNAQGDIYEYRILTSFNAFKGLNFTIRDKMVMDIHISDYVNPEDAH
jgi:hypothetical protein